MTKTNRFSIFFFALILALLGVFLGTPWPTSLAGYVDEPILNIESFNTGPIDLKDLANGTIEISNKNTAERMTIRRVLPGYAQQGREAIKGAILSKGYIRTVDGFGNPADEVYTLCFDAPGTIYILKDEVWVGVSSSQTVPDRVCYTISGDSETSYIYAR